MLIVCDNNQRVGVIVLIFIVAAICLSYRDTLFKLNSTLAPQGGCRFVSNHPSAIEKCRWYGNLTFKLSQFYFCLIKEKWSIHHCILQNYKFQANASLLVVDFIN